MTRALSYIWGGDNKSPIDAIIIDTDPDLRASVCDVLSDGGLLTIGLWRINDALLYVRKHEIKLIVTDACLGCSSLNGGNLVDAVRALRPSISCLVLSGYASCARPVGVGYLSKPFGTTELLAAVEALGIIISNS